MDPKITSHDKAVLTRIFNPNLPYGDTYEEEENVGEHFEEVETDDIKEAKRLELEGVKAAEAGQVDKALELFSQAITVAPEHPSSYNNRAQALRLKGDIPEKDNEAKCDLTHAAHLGGQFAKQLLVSMNPYAALCNQMLADVIGKLRTGEEME
ncbi:tetratricopeptide repeat protein 36-like isoform X2 [Dreissena polymorpha]|uniref:tetratricopeptide repeat protein 36-like isoform X2 n=1 Tax=Dreissena polymorpha TaxID=45954 RepID=UPI002264CDB2|nr:tetratricopeptide repeat protein 36-like isoform X2 [Dreissena polymorpha]